MSITPFASNSLSYSPKDTTLPRPVGYAAQIGEMEEPAPLDHVHPVFVENWHYVLDSELSNGWNNTAGTAELFRYLRDPMGFVHIEGKLDAGTVTAGTPIYTLPVGYRPKLAHRIVALTSSGNSVCSLLFESTGRIVLGGMVVASNLYFTGIIYESDRDTYDSFIL